MVHIAGDLGDVSIWRLSEDLVIILLCHNICSLFCVSWLSWSFDLIVSPINSWYADLVDKPIEKFVKDPITQNPFAYPFYVVFGIVPLLLIGMPIAYLAAGVHYLYVFVVRSILLPNFISRAMLKCGPTIDSIVSHPPTPPEFSSACSGRIRKHQMTIKTKSKAFPIVNRTVIKTCGFAPRIVCRRRQANLNEFY